MDVGGTFTDVVLQSGGRHHTAKVLTTYADPVQAVIEGLEQVMSVGERRPEDAEIILHGTTLATNALIQRTGAVTALIATDGHRDAVEMAYENRFEQYDIDIDRPQPLTPRKLRFVVMERMNAQGEVLIPLDESSVEALVPVLADHGVASVAVGLLHAYANPVHERRVAEILRARLPDLSVTLASGVCPEIREFERLSTACANAYVKPLMSRYLNRFGGGTCRARIHLSVSHDDVGRRTHGCRHGGAFSHPPGRIRPGGRCHSRQSDRCRARPGPRIVVRHGGYHCEDMPD